MDVIYGLIPGMILLGVVAVLVLFWAARSGQFDDLEGDGQRILMDEDMADPRRFPDAEGAPEQRYVDEDRAPGKTTKGSEGA
ncbi:MAG: cbb3-type cytochrome oxidase assembly protein CcoS [Gammaproteobacteria bacterium]|jgi:cbb3-type cytochrome oxidase maturation protein|nr:cbb3-type cytochrome oxidase assembly protein CcoS [Candidatus Thioaporhodococcus sediminis]TNF53915.1 MAG: cbb3-type cytochrome oxidase assembly protein CcoS [Gammaproteobacteria bacterium]